MPVFLIQAFLCLQYVHFYANSCNFSEKSIDRLPLSGYNNMRVCCIKTSVSPALMKHHGN